MIISSDCRRLKSSYRTRYLALVAALDFSNFQYIVLGIEKIKALLFNLLFAAVNGQSFACPSFNAQFD